MPPDPSCSNRSRVLPEYYPTRTELASCASRGGEIAALIPEGAALVEFGAGATTKVRLLLQRCEFGAYVPVDISGDFLNAQADALRGDFPALAVYPVAADFTAPFALPAEIADMPKVGFFPGSTLGNFEPHEASALPAQRARDPGRARAAHHRRRSRKERASAVRRLQRCRRRHRAVQSQCAGSHQPRTRGQFRRLRLHAPLGL